MPSPEPTSPTFALPDLPGSLPLLENVPVVVYIAEYEERSKLLYVT
ncbi:MAG: hypothetical protein JWM73_1821, partial [Solirubrobacterales bacterium]|nr:hypothetical protein [Solirubrobacterales bacterium]